MDMQIDGIPAEEGVQERLHSSVRTKKYSETAKRFLLFFITGTLIGITVFFFVNLHIFFVDFLVFLNGKKGKIDQLIYGHYIILFVICFLIVSACISATIAVLYINKSMYMKSNRSDSIMESEKNKHKMYSMWVVASTAIATLELIILRITVFSIDTKVSLKNSHKTFFWFFMVSGAYITIEIAKMLLSKKKKTKDQWRSFGFLIYLLVLNICILY
ncbi:hypothetical protein NEFER03_1587 [Nematocida sp. LUAm3]|nr:hypothetical protein NEFER03_1587 [Nematocida sp. LUAm3]KAI5176382.1 hypothetical protein NEFER02_2156 [Nematocida sp. LUAm2]KAI5179042.1 hypothetical protein NEFER01_1918 [Nematocida sp. LUAm1]